MLRFEIQTKLCLDPDENIRVTQGQENSHNEALRKYRLRPRAKHPRLSTLGVAAFP